MGCLKVLTINILLLVTKQDNYLQSITGVINKITLIVLVKLVGLKQKQYKTTNKMTKQVLSPGMHKSFAYSRLRFSTKHTKLPTWTLINNNHNVSTD